jgi:hypothetical protein
MVKINRTQYETVGREKISCDQMEHWKEFFPNHYRVYRDSDLARDLWVKKEISSREALDLAKEAARILGAGYIYERRHFQGERETGRILYILNQYPVFPTFQGGEATIDRDGDYHFEIFINPRVDGEDNERTIMRKVSFGIKDLEENPSIENLLASESRIDSELIIEGKDEEGGREMTHKTFRLTSV